MNSCKENGTHSHSHKPTKKLIWAFILTISFAIVEMYNGIIGNATVLVADAWHMITDSASILIALIVPLFLVKVKVNQTKAEAIAALACCALLLIPIWEIVERTLEKWNTQSALDAPLLIKVAVVGFFVNGICLYLVHGKNGSGHNHSHDHASIKGVELHLVGDLLGSVVAIIAGVVSYYSPETSVWADIIGSSLILIILSIGLLGLARTSWKTLQQTESAT